MPLACSGGHEFRVGGAELTVSVQKRGIADLERRQGLVGPVATRHAMVMAAAERTGGDAMKTKFDQGRSWWKTALLASGVGLAAWGPGLGAQAARLNFSWAGTYFDVPGATASWSMSSNPTPLKFNPDIEVLTKVTDGMEFVPGLYSDSFSSVLFNAPANQGGFETTGKGGVFDLGSHAYTGTEAAPMFHTGVFEGRSGTLTVTDAAPEPAAWALMLCGIGGLGAAIRARRSASVSATA